MQHTVEKVQLKNGAQGIFIDAPATNVVYFDIAFRAGNYLAPTGKMDTAHIMEHLCLGANAKYKSAREYSQEFTKHGAYSNAYTGDYHMGYIAECARFETERITDLLCLAIESPLFTEKDFKSEVANVREELKMRRNYHESELTLEHEDSMGYVAKSYTKRLKQLGKIEPQDIKNHYAKTHFANNMRFIIAGPIADNKKAIIDRLESLAMPSGDEIIALPDEKPLKLEQPLTLQIPNIDNIYYRWASVFDGLLSQSEKHALYTVQDYLFSTFHSKVFGKAREKGLVYGIESEYYRSRDNHVWVVGGQVQAKNAMPLFRLMTSELQKIANGDVYLTELNSVKDYEWGSFQKAIQTVSQLASWYQYSYFMGEKIKDYDAIEHMIYSVTQADMQAIVQKIFSSSVWGLAFMKSPTDKLPDTDINALIAKHYKSELVVET